MESLSEKLYTNSYFLFISERQVVISFEEFFYDTIWKLKEEEGNLNRDIICEDEFYNYLHDKPSKGEVKKETREIQLEFLPNERTNYTNFFLLFSSSEKIFQYTQDRGYQLDSGISFGADYLIYKSSENGTEDHIHAPYSLYIQTTPLLFHNLLGKLRVANNYSKKLVILTIAKKMSGDEVDDPISEYIKEDKIREIPKMIQESFTMSHLIFNKSKI